MNNLYEERLGTDRMLPLVFRMALPAVAAQIVNLLYSIVDRIYIGHIPGIGTDALAGIGVTSSVIILISAFSSIVGAGGAPLAAIALGQGDRMRAGKILGNGLVLLLLFTVLTSATAYLFMEPMLMAIGASEHTIGYATDYLSVYLLGTLFVEVSVGLNTFINTQGRPGIAMCSVIIGALLHCSFMRPDRKVVLSTLALGVSPFIMASTESLVGFVLNSSLKTYGDIYISALAIMQSAMLAVSVPLTGFSQGFIPIVSYNYGHGNGQRVKDCFRIVLQVMFTFNVLLVLFMILFPGLVASAFTSDGKLIAAVEQTQPVFLAGMTIFGLQRACQNMFVALGQAKVSVFIALLRKVILLVPLALLLPRGMGMMGVFAAEGISDATAAVCCTLIFAWQFSRNLHRSTRGTCGRCPVALLRA